MIIDLTTFGAHKITLKLCLPKETLESQGSFDNTPNIGSIGVLSVNFDFDKATIKKESDEAIESFYALLKAYPNMTVELRGHTDSLTKSSDLNYNFNLSQKARRCGKKCNRKKGHIIRQNLRQRLWRQRADS